MMKTLPVYVHHDLDTVEVTESYMQSKVRLKQHSMPQGLFWLNSPGLVP